MTKYGSQFSASDALKKADGRSHDAGSRHFRNYFDLAVDGGTAEALLIAVLPPGCVYAHTLFDTDANLSGVTFAIGDGTTANKFATASAGPNATQKTFYPPITLKIDPLTAQTYVYATPSGALPGAGGLRTTVTATKR